MPSDVNCEGVRQVTLPTCEMMLRTKCIVVPGLICLVHVWHDLDKAAINVAGSCIVIREGVCRCVDGERQWEHSHR